MTLFAGVFFPVDQMPLLARLIAYVLPLWHGVELCRSATLGMPTAVPALVHVGYLLAWAVVGYCLACWRTTRSSRTRGALMVTTFAAPRLAARGGSTVGRVSAVTVRDLVAVQHAGYWLVVISGFLEPVLYLLSIGIGVGNLVGDFHLADGTVVLRRLRGARHARGLGHERGMAESTFNFFAKLKWVKLYDGMVATPLRPFEIAMGELTWALLRGSLYSVAFLGIMVGLGLTTVGWAIPGVLRLAVRRGRLRRPRHGDLDHDPRAGRTSTTWAW